MLPDFHDGTYPQAAEVADILDSYADLIDDALSEVPLRVGGVAYLPTQRARRACRQAIDKLRIARDGLDLCGKFWALVKQDGKNCRPVDQVRWALEAMAEAQALTADHQADSRTPGLNRMTLTMLAETVRLAEEDLRMMLLEPIWKLSFPE